MPTEMDFFPSNFMMQATSHEADHLYHQQPNPFPQILLPSCSSQDFHGVASLLGKRSMSFSGVDVCEETHKHVEDELSDDGSQIGEKKRRLNIEQVRTLENSFKLANKLEPERKLQLARELGLQPRQIAIWFQNRRARWKTKQLEKDYEILKKQFDVLKAENHSLQAHTQKLLAQIMALKNRESTEAINLNIKETEGSCRSDENRSDVKLDISRRVPTTTSTMDDEDNNDNNNGHLLSSKQSVLPPSSRLDLNFQKMEQTTHHIKEEGCLSNMFCSIDDQTAFWPWLEQPSFN